MALDELLETIRADVERQVAALEDEARSVRQKRLDGARAEATALVTHAAEEAARDGEARVRRAEREARAATAIDALRARRLVLESLAADAKRALPSLDSPALFERLFREVLAALPDAHATISFAPRFESLAQTLADELARERRGVTLARDSRIEGAGIEARAGAVRLDDTLPSRLDAAWQALEPILAKELFS